MPKDRPYIVLNFAMSVDGKISTSQRGRLRFSSSEDWQLMDQIRSKSDAVLIGANTIRSEDPPFRIRSKKRRDERKARGKPPHPISIILSRSLDLPLSGRYFQQQHMDRIIVTTGHAPQHRIEEIRPFAEIIQTGGAQVDFHELCRILIKKNIQYLLVEGGGEVNMAFFDAGLVDEIYMTLCPVIIGGREAPTPADGNGFKADQLVKLELIQTRLIGHELFQRYRVIGN